MRTVIALTLGLALGGCDGSSILSPVQPEDIEITLDLSGGVAFVQQRVVVDGAAGEARWICGAFCPGEMTTGVVHLSSEQVEELGRVLDRSGILDMDGRDFGTECCDQLHVDLRYVRGDRSARIQGTQSRLPDELDLPVRLLSALITGRVPMLVAPLTRDTDWPRDPYLLGQVQVDRSEIAIEVTYSGGCGAHRLDLVAWGGWMESEPVQVQALLATAFRNLGWRRSFCGCGTPSRRVPSEG